MMLSKQMPEETVVVTGLICGNLTS